MNGAQILAGALGGVAMENILKVYKEANKRADEDAVLALLLQMEDQVRIIEEQINKWRVEQ